VKGVSFQFEEGAALESVEQFLAEVRQFSGSGKFDSYFRGEPKRGKTLQPSIGRRHYYAGQSVLFTPTQERSMLHRFRRHAYTHFQRVPTEWETLFLARHHGLPTRLLDWTSNPLVALYFAAFHENDEITYQDESNEAAALKLNLDGGVWAVQRRADAHDLDVFDSQVPPLAVRGIKLVYPFYPTSRMTAQSGMFTIHENPWMDVIGCAGKKFREGDLDIAKLKRWTVSSRCKADVILELERLAVNSRTLFPDLDGLAKGLWQTEVIRSTAKTVRRQSPMTPPRVSKAAGTSRSARARDGARRELPRRS
jgi:hypothetical protein